MRLVELIARLDERPTVVVDATAARLPLDRYVGRELGADVVSLESPGADWGQDVPDEATVFVLVAVVDEDVGETVKLVAEQAATHHGPVTLALLLSVPPEELPTPVVMELRDRHDLEVLEVTALDYTMVRLGVVLATRRPSDDARIWSQLRLERFASAVFERRARIAERRAELADELAAELERRAARIAVLEARERELDGGRRSAAARAEVAEGRAADASAEIARLRDRVTSLERSTSYRLGHYLVRVVKEPRMLLRLPGILVRLVRR